MGSDLPKPGGSVLISWVTQMASHGVIGFLLVLLPLSRSAAAQEPASAAPTPTQSATPAPASIPSPPPQATHEEKNEEKAGGLTLEQLLDLDITVVSSTKTAMRGAQTPAVVTTVSSDEIQARGYTSLADVLRSVPGFYDIDDHVTHNFGVRGVNGGARASGSVLKVMIDGMPVNFSPTTGNFFGEELVPLAIVDRIEIIRGPASALYGANAYLGVVNIITRKPGALPGVRAIGVAADVNGHAGGGGGAAGSWDAGGGYGTVIAATGFYFNRSGLKLPSESPALLSEATLASRSPSQGDTARPRSLFFEQSQGDVAGGSLSLLGSIQNLDSGAEFQDLGPLTHGTRVGVLNQNYRLTWRRDLLPGFSLESYGQYGRASLTADNRFDVGNAEYVYLPRVGADEYLLGSEANWVASSRVNLSAGADYDDQNQRLQTFDQLLIRDQFDSNGVLTRPKGSIVPGQGNGAHKQFTNVGAFAQALVTLPHDITAAAGARLDRHSIYGNNLSPRFGLTWAPLDKPLSVKLLYGSSFKAPSPVQLYTQPMTTLDIEGNPDLRAQSAQTLELAGGAGLPQGRGEISANVFLTDVNRRVEFIRRGVFLQAQNLAGERVAGGELSGHVNPIRDFRIRLSASAAKTIARSGPATVSGAPIVENTLFPAWQAHLLGDWAVGIAGIHFAPEISVIGPRPASQSNALVAGDSYELKQYVYTALAISTARRKILGTRLTSIALRIGNALDQRWTEPGFGGVDVPSNGRSFFLTVEQGL